MFGVSRSRSSKYTGSRSSCQTKHARLNQMPSSRRKATDRFAIGTSSSRIEITISYASSSQRTPPITHVISECESKRWHASFLLQIGACRSQTRAALAQVLEQRRCVDPGLGLISALSSQMAPPAAAASSDGNGTLTRRKLGLQPGSRAKGFRVSSELRFFHLGKKRRLWTGSSPKPFLCSARRTRNPHSSQVAQPASTTVAPLLCIHCMRMLRDC